MTNSVVSNNICTTGDGGGISNDGSMTMVFSTIEGNQSTSWSGGGISNVSAVVEDSIITGNTALRVGGGIRNDGNLTPLRTTISNNVAGEQGGGIIKQGGNTVTATDSPISGNSAGSEDGGINNNNATLSLTNGRVSTNTAEAGWAESDHRMAKIEVASQNYMTEHLEC